MSRLLEGKRVLITGCNRGIGNEIMKVFAENGANVYAHARTPRKEFETECEAVASSNSVKIKTIYFDILDENAVKIAISNIRKDGQIDVLVNNIASVESIKLFEMTSMEEIKREFDINFFSQLKLTQYVIRLMKKNGGSIINISACAAIDAYSGMLPYVSSKSAMIGATKRMAIELGSQNIRVNSIAPGLTDTAMADKMSDDLEKRTLSHVIMGRKATTREIANGALFLASDLSSYITGQTIRIDGGMLL